MRKARDREFVGIYEVDEYRIDVVINHNKRTGDYYEAYIYHKDYGIKTGMFGLPTENCTLKEFLNIVEGNLYDGNGYIYGYEDDISIFEDATCDEIDRRDNDAKKLKDIFDRTKRNCDFYLSKGDDASLMNEIGVLRGIAYCLEATRRLSVVDSSRFDEFIEMQQNYRKTLVDKTKISAVE